jgi:general secretion pathway protein C
MWKRILPGLLFLSACGGGASAPSAPAKAPAAAPETTAARVNTPAKDPKAAAPSSISRSKLKAVVAEGPGAFLQKIVLDDRPVFVGGKFHGFRVVSLKDALASSDLRAGDVITRVNGMPIERPEQAVEVFRALPAAKELRVSYERDGEPKELVYPITED